LTLLGPALAGPPRVGDSFGYFPVTTTADSGPGSLRAAVEAVGDGDTIYFVPALDGQTITLTSGELAINANITITGPGPDLLTVSRNTGAPPFRIFHVLPGHAVIIEGLTIRGGGDDGGGGIRNDRSALSIRNCIIRENSSSGAGGGIYNDGSSGSAILTIVDSSVTANIVRFAGGGIYNDALDGHAILSLWNSSVTNNSAAFFDPPFNGGGDGGGIASTGKMTLTNCTVSGNRAGVGHPFPIGDGGGIINFGTLKIIGSTINNNQSYGVGGGISNSGSGPSSGSGPLTIINSTVNGNLANGQHDGKPWGLGGGIFNFADSAVTFINSTLSNNSGAHSGGGLYGRLAVITNSTISGNTASEEGGGIFATGGVTIGNTILKAGTSGANIDGNPGTVTSQGYNLSSDDGGGFLNATGDQINTDPLLGPLQFNGGPTFTHQLLTGSPAINAGDPNFTPPPFYDQRGPDYDRVFNGRLDSGSLEVQPAPTPSPPPTPAPTPCGVLTFLSENFDSTTPPALPPGWVSDFTPGPADCTPAGTCALVNDWATTPTNPDTPAHAMFHDDPGCVTDSTLDTPFFDGGATNGTFLFFRHRYDLEDGRDGAVLEISINGGPFVDFVAAGGGNLGYNGTISTDFLSPIAGRSAWTGNSGGYITTFVQMPLSGHHRAVRLRFRLATDCSGAGTGWWIDSIKISDNVGCQSPSPTPPPPSPTPTATATPTATVPPPTPTPSATVTPSPTPTSTPSPTPGRALNISTRMLVQTGDRVGIGGFIITGSAPKEVLLRGIGPSLAQVGVLNPLVDPVMELHGPAGFTTITNDNWEDTQAAEIIATLIPPIHDLESAILVTLDPGAYTAIVKGNNDASGVGLVEVYDLSPAASKLANISTRAFVGAGTDVMIGGFILGGDANSQIAILGIGPSLAGSGVGGVLADPTLELRNSSGDLIASNDNCGANSIHPLDPAEACIEASLAPGLYTAILAGNNGGTGIGLVEVYHVQ
jgi:hypothetical protein